MQDKDLEEIAFHTRKAIEHILKDLVDEVTEKHPNAFICQLRERNGYKERKLRAAAKKLMDLNNFLYGTEPVMEGDMGMYYYDETGDTRISTKDIQDGSPVGLCDSSAGSETGNGYTYAYSIHEPRLPRQLREGLGEIHPGDRSSAGPNNPGVSIIPGDFSPRHGDDL